VRRASTPWLSPQPLTVAGVTKEPGLSAPPGFDGARGVLRGGGAASAVEGLLFGTLTARKEPGNDQNTDNNDRCDDLGVGVHCRLTVELSGAHADV
jgi:hypothetical protein